MEKLLLKKFLRFFALTFLPPFGAFLIRFIYLTNKKVYVLPERIPEDPFIVAFWHGDLLMQPYLYKQLRKQSKIKVLISDHFDGQIIAAIIRFFNFDTIHGSTTRGGAKVLLQGLKSLSEGYDIGITPDGPKGPRHSVSDGIVIMAQKRKAEVIFFECVPSAYWQLKSWDRFTIPKPFGTLYFYASNPVSLDDLESDEAKNVVYNGLMQHRVEH